MITSRVLGAPGRDNSLLVVIDSGQSVERLLFDCGDNCLSNLPFGEIQSIDHLFFSHLHMDHVGGFDSFFRCNFNRISKQNQIWGPPGTTRTMQHRFQGFLWNLHDEMSGSWHVSDVTAAEVPTSRFELTEAFAECHDEGATPHKQILLDRPNYTVQAFSMEHRTPTLAYVIREKSKQHLDMSRLASLAGC